MAEDKRPNLIIDDKCTFCLSTVSQAVAVKRYGDLVEVMCPGCGVYRISGTAIAVLPRWDLTLPQWAAIAYQVRRMTGRAEPPVLDTYVLEALKERARLPHADQIVDDFVLWIGSNSTVPGQAFHVDYEQFHTLLGVAEPSTFDYMLGCLEQSGYFAGERVTYVSETSRLRGCALSPFGWRRFRELSQSRAETRYGFMAMKYNDEQIDTVVRNHFAPEVALAGLELRRLDDGQPLD